MRFFLYNLYWEHLIQGLLLQQSVKQLKGTPDFLLNFTFRLQELVAKQEILRYVMTSSLLKILQSFVTSYWVTGGDVIVLGNLL